ncbi:MAG: beta-N-acetylhexosaminidase [Candidatus Eremiobacteraeota bacterium]|nr:beta-N-acetylhexosaminidase [Candidatus Eremiobacteraeota bacterium]
MNTAESPSHKEATDPVQLDDRSLAAGLIMIERPGTEVDGSFREEYRQNPWGGIILFGKNIAGAEQLRALTASFQEAAGAQVPLLIGVDHEGGIVSRFSFPSITPLCGNMALGAAGKKEYAYESGRICAFDLRGLGINTNFAPCVDVNSNPLNPIIGARSFGESPQAVAELGAAYARGLMDGGIIASAKHFPGHGDVSIDTHSALPAINRSRESLEETELVPFLAVIREGVDMVMTSHITFPALDPSGLPATLSRAILTGLLRETLHYEGVIITDSMAMNAIRNGFGYAEAAIMTLETGADIAMLCGSREEQLEALEAIVKALESGRLSREAFIASYRRILRLRGKAGDPVPSESPVSHEKNDGAMKVITEASITLVKNEGGMLPLTEKAKQDILLVSPSLFPPSPLGEAHIKPTLARHLEKFAPRVTSLEFDVKSGAHDSEKLAVLAEKASAIIYTAFCNGRLPEGQRKIAASLLRHREKLAVASLNSPYVLMDIADVKACVNCYNYGDLSTDALARVLEGSLNPTGKLPVSLPGLYPLGHSLSYR